MYQEWRKKPYQKWKVRWCKKNSEFISLFFFYGILISRVILTLIAFKERSYYVRIKKHMF